MKFNFKKLRSKLFVTFLSVIILIMAVSTIFYVITDSQRIKSDLKNNLASNSVAASVMLENSIKEISGIGAYIASDNSIKYSMGFGLSSQVEETAKNLKKKYRLIDEMVITDSTGAIKYSEGEDFKNAAAGLATMGNTVSGLYKSGNLFLVSGDVIKGDGNSTIGYVLIAHNIEKDTSMLMNMSSRLKCYVMLYRGNNLISMSDANNKVYKLPNINYGAVNSSKIFKSKDGIYVTNSTSSLFSLNIFRNFKTLYDINNNPVGLLTVAQTDKVLNASIKSIILSMILIALVCCAAGSVIIFIFATFITKPINNLKDAAEKIAVGDVEVTLKSASEDEIGQLTRAFGSMVENIRENAAIVEKIAEGDLEVQITAKSDKDILSKSMIHVTETLTQLNNEERLLTKAAIEGNLDARGNAEEFNGVYKVLIEELNRMLDSIAKPISLASKSIECVAKGELNNRENVSVLLDNYSINKGYYSILATNISSVLNTLGEIFLEIEKGTLSAVEGQLSVRMAGDSLQGDWKKLPHGINAMLDAIIEPINETSGVLQEMAAGNLKVNVRGEYKGDHANLKVAVNTMLESLSNYITEISRILSGISGGNLNLSISGEYKGDFIEIKESINMIIDSLNAAMREIDVSAQQVSSGSQQLSDSSMALSQGSTEQAASIEEITASMTEIATQTKENAGKANEANDLAVKAKEDAILGKTQMQDMLIAMEEINKSSEDISNIIKVIDEIAFQTNILALNAAVEAARAGQYGKGFAVVAEEVRNLAARSSDAAKETTALIEDSIKKVEDGTRIASTTASALNNIADGITIASDLVGGIAFASNEQANSILQINLAIEQVGKVTETNSALAEESAAANEELSSQAEGLKKLIEKFNMKELTKNNDFSLQSDKELLLLLEKISGDMKLKEGDVTGRLDVEKLPNGEKLEKY